MKHATLIDQLGGGTKVAIALTDLTGTAVDREVVYKWKVNGVPWRWRVHVARLAKQAGQPLPDDFFGEELESLRSAG